MKELNLLDPLFNCRFNCRTFCYCSPAPLIGVEDLPSFVLESICIGDSGSFSGYNWAQTLTPSSSLSSSASRTLAKKLPGISLPVIAAAAFVSFYNSMSNPSTLSSCADPLLPWDSSPDSSFEDSGFFKSGFF